MSATGIATEERQKGLPPELKNNPPKYKREKTPSILQMEMVECGAASLAMILAYYGLYVPLEKLRIECGVTRDGVKASNMLKAARKLGLSCKGYRYEPAELRGLKPPMIIHWNFNHFLVLEGFSPNKDKVYLNDPASGRRTVDWEEFDLSFTGVVLTFEPDTSFQPGGAKTSMLGSLQRRLTTAKVSLIMLSLIGLLLVVPGIIVPTFSQLFIDEVMLAGRSDWLKPLLWCMGATALVTVLLNILQQRYLQRTDVKLALVGASSFFWHILRLPIVFFQQRSAGDISSRMNSNDSVAAFIARDLATNIINCVTVIFYFFVMMQYNVVLTLIALVLAAGNVAYFLYSSQKIEAANGKAMRDFGKMYGTAVSGLYIIETLKATGSESDFFSKWAGYHAKVLNGQQELGKVSQVLFTLPNFLGELAEVFVLCVGGLQILQGNLTVGSLIAFQGLLGNFMSPINGITQLGTKVKQLKGDMARLDDVMKYKPDPLCDPADDLPADEMEDKSFEKLEGYIDIQNLAFGYNVLEPPLIENFSLSLKPGSRVALVGSSGSGKSTVTKIISGIQHQWSGAILLDGREKDTLPRNLLVNSISVVDQDISMFDGTIMENLTMWDNTIDEKDVVRAAKDACIHDDINKRTGGYQSKVSEGGSNFSGGQRQRLEIARALATNPTILIMDEATSALDTTTEQRVNDNIRRRCCTCIVVAHRLSTIRDCDEIIVLNRGKIVQRGTHDEMKNVPGPYAELIQTAV